MNTKTVCLFLMLVALLGPLNAQDLTNNSTESTVSSTLLPTESTASSTQFTTSGSSKPTESPIVSTTPSSSGDRIYAVTDLSGNVCLLMRFNATFKLVYTDTESKKQKVDVPFNHKRSLSGGTCNNNGTQSIIIMWRPVTMPTDMTQPDWWLSMNFAPIRLANDEAESASYTLENVTLIYTLENSTFPNVQQTGQRLVFAKSTENVVVATEGQSYRCTAERKMKLTEDDEEIDIRDFQVEAFRTSNSTQFSSKETICPEDNHPSPSYVVPIVVGIILALLIVVGLIAYFVGRRRPQSTYEAM